MFVGSAMRHARLNNMSLSLVRVTGSRAWRSCAVRIHGTRCWLQTNRAIVSSESAVWRISRSCQIYLQRLVGRDLQKAGVCTSLYASCQLRNSIAEGQWCTTAICINCTTAFCVSSASALSIECATLCTVTTCCNKGNSSRSLVSVYNAAPCLSLMLSRLMQLQIDKLQTDHRGTFVLRDLNFRWLNRYAPGQ
jgi:hypothetical protein